MIGFLVAPRAPVECPEGEWNQLFSLFQMTINASYALIEEAV